MFKSSILISSFFLFLSSACGKSDDPKDTLAVQSIPPTVGELIGKDFPNIQYMYFWEPTYGSSTTPTNVRFDLEKLEMTQMTMGPDEPAQAIPASIHFELMKKVAALKPVDSVIDCINVSTKSAGYIIHIQDGDVGRDITLWRRSTGYSTCGDQFLVADDELMELYKYSADAFKK